MRHLLTFSIVVFISAALFSFVNKKETTQAEPELKESILKGKEVYMGYCMSCHMNEGEGLAGAFPPLAKSDYLMEDKERSIHIVMYGQEGPIVVNGEQYDSVMPNFGLTDEEITHVLNYVRNSWGNEGDVVTFAEVKKVREAGSK